MHYHVNNASLILLILQVDYIEKVIGMKPTKWCLCRKTVKVAVEWQQNNL